jgi:chitodextrinase
MNLPKPNIIKPLALLIPLLITGGNTHATEYRCDPSNDMDGITYNQILTPLPILASERPFLTSNRLAWMKEKKARDDVHAKNFLVNASANRATKDSPMAQALAYRLTGNDVYLEQARAAYQRRYVNDTEKFGNTEMGYETGCLPNNFRDDGKYLPLYYMYLYDELTEEERAEAVRTMAYIGEYWLKYIPGNHTPIKEKPSPQRHLSDSDETVMLAENLLFYGLALRGTELGERLITMSDKYFEEYSVPLFIDGIFKGGVWGEGLEYSVKTNVHWPLTYLLNKQYRPEKLAEYATKGWDFDTFFNNAIEGYIAITVGGMTQSWTQGSNQHPYAWFVGEEFVLPNIYRSMAIFSGATTSERHKKLANGYMEDLKDKWGAIRTLNTGAWHMLFEEPSLATLSPQTAGMPTTFVAEGPNLVHTRTDWGPDASSFYIAAPIANADHINRDTLAFDYFRKGQRMSGERYSYDGDTADSISHNMLLIAAPDSYAGKYTVAAEFGGRCEGCPSSNPAGEGEILHHAEAPNYNYAALDGTLSYNEGKATRELGQYIPHVSRQVVNIKPDAFIVFDNVITDKTKYYDFRWSTAPIDSEIVNGEWLRKIEYLQHFQSEPIKDDNGFLVTHPENVIIGEYIQNVDGDWIPETSILKQEMKFKTLLPEDPITVVVDEEEYWGLGTPEDPAFRVTNSIPPEQRKWHIRVRPQVKTEQVKFLSMFFGGDDGAVVTPTQSIVMNKEKGHITNRSADVTGVALEMSGEWHVIVFPERPDVDLSNVSYDLSFIPDGAVVHHYVNGVSEDQYFYNESNGVFSFGSASGTPITNNAGSLYQRTQDGQPYAGEFEAPSAPTGFVGQESNATELGFSWIPSTDNVAVTSYAIYRGTSASPYITVNGPWFTDTGLKSDTSYTYTVVALDLDGNESAPSESFTAKTQPADYRAPVVTKKYNDKDGEPNTGGPILRPTPYPEIRSVALDDGLERIRGVYPAAGSNDVDASENLLMIDFTGVYTFHYQNGVLTLTNLDTGEKVYQINPEHGADDDQGGFTSRRFVMELPEGTLQPDSNYQVTMTTRFASFNSTPYKMEEPVENGAWTFSTASASPVIPDVADTPELPTMSNLDIAGTQVETLLFDGGFEKGVNFLALGDHLVTGELTEVNTITGNYSADLTLKTYGRVIVPHYYPWGAQVHGKALQAYGQVRLPEVIIEGSILKLCSVAYFSGGSKELNCEVITGEAGETVSVEAVLNLDPTQNIRRVYSWLQYIGSEGPINVTVDELELVIYRSDLN